MSKNLAGFEPGSSEPEVDSLSTAPLRQGVNTTILPLNKVAQNLNYFCNFQNNCCSKKQSPNRRKFYQSGHPDPYFKMTFAKNNLE
jgi:hypothetical protein